MCLYTLSPIQIWNDFRLSWNPIDYEGVQYLSLNANDIWVPNIGLRNRYAYQDQPEQFGWNDFLIRSID